MMLRPMLALVLALAAVGASSPSDAAGQLRLRTSVDTTQATVGDRIVLTVAVDHPVGASVVWPDSLDLSPFEVMGAQATPTESTAGGARSSARFVLTAFELGELEIPSFEVDVLTADGGRETLSTDRYGIEIVSVGADETGDIRDIRGPLSIQVGILTVALWVVMLLLLVLAVWLAWRRWKRRPEAAPVAPAAPPRPAHEIALEALARIEASDLLATGRVKEYHIEVSEVLRRYVEARFDVTALEMTTWEVLAGLEKAGVDADFRDGLRGFLDQCDLVKFAKVRPDGSRSRAVLTMGRELVERARTIEGAPVASPAAATAGAHGAPAVPVSTGDGVGG